jgi:GNAT superfamily N-acetyltransferase
VTQFRIRSLDRDLDADLFACGQAALDDYIRRYASQDVRRNLARVFVVTPDSDGRRLAGFFTLSAGSVRCTELPISLAKKLPRYPVPVALIGRLAVDHDFQGQGLGSILLADACQRVGAASVTLAVAGIVVDAKDDSAASFYRHFGFAAMPGCARRLMLPTAAFRRRLAEQKG